LDKSGYRSELSIRTGAAKGDREDGEKLVCGKKQTSWGKRLSRIRDKGLP